MLKYSSRHLARLAGATVFALAGVPAQAQWNLYGNGPTFYVPFTNPNIQSTTKSRYVSLTLNTASGPKATHFLVDTGSLGIVAGSNSYQYVQGSGDINLGAGGITYTTSGTSPSGTIYLTNVTINGANGQTATTRVPILAASDAGSAQMGIGFDRPGVQVHRTGFQLPNMNLFLGLRLDRRAGRHQHEPGLHHGPRRTSR